MILKNIIIAVLLSLLMSLPVLALTPGNEVTVTSSLSSPSGQRNPDLAYGSSTYLAVWEQGANVDSDSVSQIYAGRLNASGAAQDANGIQVMSSSDGQIRPRVVFGDSVFCVVWQEYNDAETDWDIYAAIIDPSDGSVDATTAICTEFHDQIMPDIAWDDTNNVFVIVWSDWRKKEWFQLYMARMGEDGVLDDANGIKLFEYTSETTVAYGNSIYYEAIGPRIQINNSHETPQIFVAWSELAKMPYRSGSNYTNPHCSRARFYDLDGTNGTDVYVYASGQTGYGKIDLTLPSNWGSPVMSDIVSDGSDFMWMFHTFRTPTIGNAYGKQFLQAVFVNSSGSLPNDSQIDIDSKEYALSGCGVYLGGSYYAFYPVIDQSIANYNSDPLDDNFDLVGTQIDDEVTTAYDYSDPIEVSMSSASEKNPAAATNGASILVVYESDNLLSNGSLEWVIKARLLISELIGRGSMTMVAPGTPGAGRITLGN